MGRLSSTDPEFGVRDQFGIRSRAVSLVGGSGAVRIPNVGPLLSRIRMVKLIGCAEPSIS